MSALTFTVGTTWVFSVPPSWLVAAIGCIDASGVAESEALAVSFGIR